MRNAKQWRVSVEATTQSREIAGKEWKVIGKDDRDKEIYGYTPEIEKMVERRETVLDQRMDELDLRALVAVINGLQARDVAIVEGGVDLTAHAAKEIVLDAFGWSRNPHTGAWHRDWPGRVVPGLASEWVETRTLHALCFRVVDLEQVATKPHHPDDPSESGPGGTKEWPFERKHPCFPSADEVGTRIAALISAGYVHSHGCYVHARQRKILTPQWVNETDLSRFISGIASFNDSPERWLVLSTRPIPEEVYQRIVEHCKVQ